MKFTREDIFPGAQFQWDVLENRTLTLITFDPSLSRNETDEQRFYIGGRGDNPYSLWHNFVKDGGATVDQVLEYLNNHYKNYRRVNENTWKEEYSKKMEERFPTARAGKGYFSDKLVDKTEKEEI
jgi:hypothetical protein